MSEWKEYKLGEIASFKTGKLNSNAAVENGVYPFFTCSPITLSIDKYAYDQKAILLAGNNAEGNFCIKYYEGKFNAYQRTYIIESQEDVCNLKFLYYSLKLCLQEFKNISQGTSTRFLTAVILNNFEIHLPPLNEQKRIASILCSLDDKIDLLNRENATLEAMAETLFRQWFIEEAKEDWEEKSLSDCIMLIGGGTPKTSESNYWNGSICWLSGGDIANNHKGFVLATEKRISDEGLNNSSAKLLPENAMVVSARGTVGKYCLLSKPMAFSQSNYGIMPKYDNCFFFNYLLIAYHIDELQSAAYGSVFDTITTKSFEGVYVALPQDKDFIIEFEKMVEPYFSKMKNNALQIQSLAKTRDLLLSKLMSNEIQL